MNEICEDKQPQLLCLQTILVRHGEGPCHRLSPKEKALCPKTCQTCNGPGCQPTLSLPIYLDHRLCLT
ncbi:Oidioi.mRNA.OKI2018_I69.XSR.g15923.t1.cds [Oikopleura dioica]|uniref:Oidioi.mRNA.OKI2018_I69.XSR.g15923.t1.cds n=1 Tax=Oikopleura dioica TaxID=34765 RepID=A0ABN7SKS5_OIKDI|nr:Oidioi.mRNA.OKI2018_I69.XSR.g15923.t1.cds [Oikopleura dioica]